MICASSAVNTTAVETELSAYVIPLLSPSTFYTAILFFFTTCMTIFISHQIFAKRTERLLREEERKWLEKHRWEQQCSTLIESIPSGWFNILLTSIWPSLLERFCAELVTERLEKSFQRRLTAQSKKFPWRHLSRVDVEHVTFGLSPPQFEAILAKYDPEKQALKLEADLKWTTSAFQIVVCPVIQSPMFQELKTRFLLSNLDISGRICATLYFCQNQPGIKSCEMSFCQVPSIDMRITPIGMALKDFPGIPESLRSTIVKSLTKEMVFPKKFTINVRHIYDTQRMKRRGGVGGLLTLTLASASGFCGESDSNAEVFCECEFGKRVFRTPIRRGAQSVVWDWNCAIKIDEKISQNTEQQISIRLFNTKSIGEPNLMAYGTVDSYISHFLTLFSFPVTKSVALESVIDYDGRKPSMQLICQLTEPKGVEISIPAHPTYDTEISPSSPHEENDVHTVLRSTTSCPIVSSEGGVDRGTMGWRDGDKAEEALVQCCRPLIEIPSSETANGHCSTDSQADESPIPSVLLDSGLDLNAESDVSFVANDPTSAAPSHDSSIVDRDATGYMSLLHVTKFDDALRRDRAMYRHRLSKMQTQVSQLERRLLIEHKRRIEDSIRSMTEGGRFFVHKHHERVIRHLWYDSTTNELNWATQKWPLHETAAHMWQIKTQPLHQIREIRAGIECFPKSTIFGFWGLRSFVQRKLSSRSIIDASTPSEANCLSILFANNKALNLEIPQGGNGRSRDAWVEALQVVINQKLATKQATQETKDK